jgi:hypothetical protein
VQDDDIRLGIRLSGKIRCPEHFDEVTTHSTTDDAARAPLEIDISIAACGTRISLGVATTET